MARISRIGMQSGIVIPPVPLQVKFQLVLGSSANFGCTIHFGRYQIQGRKKKKKKKKTLQTHQSEVPIMLLVAIFLLIFSIFSSPSSSSLLHFSLFFFFFYSFNFLVFCFYGILESSGLLSFNFIEPHDISCGQLWNQMTNKRLKKSCVRLGVVQVQWYITLLIYINVYNFILKKRYYCQ